MMHKAWSSIGEVPYCFSRSSVKFQGHKALKIVKFDPNWPFLDSNSSLNIPMATKWCTKLEVALKRCPIVFSCDQALWMVFSVRPSVRLSHLFDYVPIIVSSWNFQELSHWTRVRSMQKVKVRGQGHRGHDPNFRFRTVTPVWIHIWWWNDTYSLMLLRRGALLFFKVIHQISRSHGAKIAEFDPDWAFPDCNSSLNSPMAMKWCTKLEVA